MKEEIVENIIPDPNKIYAQTIDYGIFPLTPVTNLDKITPIGSKSKPNSRTVINNPLTGRRYYLPQGLDEEDAREIIGIQSGRTLLSPEAIVSNPQGEPLFESTASPN